MTTLCVTRQFNAPRSDAWQARITSEKLFTNRLKRNKYESNTNYC